MSVLDTVFGAVDNRFESTRAAMRVKAVGAESIIAGSVSGPLKTGFSGINTAAEQYRAASMGYQFTAIRPIAVKAADQAMRAGVRVPDAMTKRYRKLQMWRKLYGDRDDRLAIDCAPFRHEATLDIAPKHIKAIRQDVDVVDEHVALAAFEDPNPYMTQWALMYCTVFSLEATGEAIWVLDPQPDGLVHIWYIPRSWAKPVHEDDRMFVAWKITPPGSTGDNDPIPSELVCHFQYPNPGNPTAGHSALSAQAYAVNTDDEIQKSQFHLVKNMQRPSMLITLGEMTSPEGKKGGRPELSPKQRKDMVQSVRRHYADATKFGDPMVLDRLVDNVQPYLPGLVDLDFEHGGKVTKDRIMQGIGVNPIVTGDTENANRASAWVAHDSVNQMKVNPVLTLIGQTLTKKLPLIVQDATLLIWFDNAKAQDPDLKLKRMALVVNSGSMTRGEVRKYGETGEFEAVPRDDDDDLVKGKSSGPPSPQQQTGDPNSPNATPGKDGQDVDDADENKSFDPYFLLEAIDYGKSLGEQSIREKNCGTGAGGFKPGNTCAGTGGGGSASGGGGGGSDLVEVRPGDAVTHQGTVISSGTEQLKAAVTAEEDVAGMSVERVVSLDKDGNRTVDQIGTKTYIDLTADQQKAMKGAMTIHNHPDSDTSFSAMDVAGGLLRGEAESRVITNNMRYSMKYNKLHDLTASEKRAKVLEIAKDYEAAMKSNAKRVATMKGFTFDQKRDILSHLGWVDTAKKHGLSYKRELHGQAG